MAHLKRSYASVASGVSVPSVTSSNLSSPPDIFDSPPAAVSPWTINSTPYSFFGRDEPQHAPAGPRDVGAPTSGSDCSAPQDQQPLKPNHKPVLRHIYELKPPQIVKDALDTVQEARHRVTIQFYYGMPKLFDHGGCEAGSRGRIRLLKDIVLVEAAKHAVLLSLFATIRAAIVLIGRETQAMRALQRWLIELTLRGNESAKGVQRYVQRTLGHLREA